ncbi:MAG: hypothetical protein M0R51_09025, partial [Clostridia bacterium]|nr:hypothetical protein [Clostridia bacterium]
MGNEANLSVMNFDAFQKGASILVNNTYSYSNNTIFYAFANPTFFDYYHRVVKRAAWWLDGYVPDFHNADQGIFSTRIAQALVRGISSQITGKQISFKNGSNTKGMNGLDFISHKWAATSNFTQSTKEGISYAIGLGTSLLKLNSTAGGELWCRAERLDYFYFSTDFRGKLHDLTCFIRGYTDTNKDKTQYFLVEHRYFLDTTKKKTFELKGAKYTFDVGSKIPVVEYQVHRYSGTAVSHQNMAAALSGDKGLMWESIPRSIRNKVNSDYGMIMVNQPQRLPFDEHLGAVLLKYGGTNISLSQTCFGTSVIEQTLSYLMRYELYYAWSIRDAYNGKGIVAIPSTLSQSDLVGSGSRALDGMETPNFEYKGDPDKNKPIVYQHELRVDQWRQGIDDTLKLIATTIGMSPKVIASYLTAGAIEKTATEIDEETDSTL